MQRAPSCVELHVNAVAMKIGHISYSVTSLCMLASRKHMAKPFQAALRIVFCPLDATQTFLEVEKKKKLRGLSPRANYTDRAAAAGRRS